MSYELGSVHRIPALARWCRQLAKEVEAYPHKSHDDEVAFEQYHTIAVLLESLESMVMDAEAEQFRNAEACAVALAHDKATDERAARGFHRAMVGLSYDGKPWEELSEGERERCREIVRATGREEGDEDPLIYTQADLDRACKGEYETGYKDGHRDGFNDGWAEP